MRGFRKRRPVRIKLTAPDVYRPVASAIDIDDDPAADFSIQDIRSSIDCLTKADLRGDGVQRCTGRGLGLTGPRRPDERCRRHNTVNAEKRNAAQDEGRNRSMKIHALGQAAGGNRTTVFCLSAGVDQCMAADGVDNAGPALLLHRLAWLCQFITIDNSRGPERGKVIRL